jgi:Spy/CpxP family protein refolding chaperone
MRAIRILTAAALVFVASTAAAQGGQGARAGGGQGGQAMQQRQNEMLFKGITLTEAQRTKIDSLQATSRTAMQAAMQGGGMQDSTARAKVLEMRQKHQAEVRAVLTAEQRVIYDKNIAEMPQRGAGRRPPGRR